MASSIGIKVETIDHYTRNNDMELIDAPPPELNCQPVTRELETPYSLTKYKHPDSWKIEHHMESLLHYIHDKRLDEKSDIVTIRQLITAVAGGAMKELLVIPFLGVLFLLPKKIIWDDESSGKKSSSNEWREKAYQVGANFQHYMTQARYNQPFPTEGNVFKAVLKTTIDGQSITYSGEIDALVDDDEHIELKVISGGIENDWFFSRNSQKFYWQAYFGNVNTILVGARTDKSDIKAGPSDKKDIKPGPSDKKDVKTRSSNSYPEYSLYKVQKVNREDIPNKKYMEKKPVRPNSWNVQSGKDNVHKFFELVKEKCAHKEACFVATSEKSGEDVKWKFKRVDDRGEVKAFRAKLGQILGNDEKKLFRTANELPDGASEEYSSQDSGNDLEEPSKKQMRKESKAKTPIKKRKRGNSGNAESDEDFEETSEQKSDNRKQYERNKRSRNVESDDEKQDEEQKVKKTKQQQAQKKDMKQGNDSKTEENKKK